MRNSCPISSDILDEHVLRGIAAQVVLLTAVALWQGYPWLPLCLAADFGLRSAGLRRYSPLALVATRLQQLTGWPPQPANAGPKQFAARIGAVMSLGIALCLACGWQTAAQALGGMLIVCAVMEAALGFCVGCHLYGLWMRFAPRSSQFP